MFDETFGTVDVGTYQRFKVERYCTSTCFASMTLNGTAYAYTNFDPVAEWEVLGWPLEAQWNNETDRLSNDIAGSQSAQVNWTVVHVKWRDTTWNEALPDATANPNPLPCAYTRTVNLSVPNFQTWTYNPSHSGC